MIAKLFDDISLRSLINALGVVLLLLFLLVAINFQPEPLGFFKIQFTASSWLAKIIGAAMVFVSAVVYNSFAGRNRGLNSGNHVLVLFAVLAEALLLFEGSIYASTHLLLLFVFVARGNSLVNIKNTIYAYFDLGMLVAALSIVNLEYVILLPLSWVFGILIGRVSPKSVIASILGFGGFCYMTSIIAIAFDFNLWAWLIESFENLSFSFSYGKNVFIPTYFPLTLLLIMVFAGYPGIMAKANANQRLNTTFYYGLLILGILAWVLSAQKTVWLAFLTFPFSWLLSLFLMNTKNKWLRDSVYFLLLLALGLEFGANLGLISF